MEKDALVLAKAEFMKKFNEYRCAATEVKNFYDEKCREDNPLAQAKHDCCPAHRCIEAWREQIKREGEALHPVTDETGAFSSERWFQTGGFLEETTEN